MGNLRVDPAHGFTDDVRDFAVWIFKKICSMHSKVRLRLCDVSWSHPTTPSCVDAPQWTGVLLLIENMTLRSSTLATLSSMKMSHGGKQYHKPQRIWDVLEVANIQRRSPAMRSICSQRSPAFQSQDGAPAMPFSLSLNLPVWGRWSAWTACAIPVL